MKISLDNYEFEYGKVVSNPKAEENKLSFLLQNDSGFIIKKWKIDEVVFKHKEEGCDFLILAEKEAQSIYFWIELKRGSDILKASRQIENALRLIDINVEARHEARIVVTKIYEPVFLDNTYLKFIRHIRSLNGKVKVYTYQGSEKI